MIKHYFKIAFRNLLRQKGLAFINVVGLSLGLACFILFLLNAVNEFNYDKFHKNGDNIYRVARWSEAMQGDPAGGDIYLPMPLGPALKQELPDVQEFVRFQEAWGESFIRANNKISTIPVSFADPQLFSVFSFKLKSGDKVSPFQGLNNIVLTEKIAVRLFGNENAVGKTIEIKLFDQFESFVVTAIANDLPTNSSIRFDILANYEYIPTTPSGKRSVNNWQRSSYQTYIQLKEGSLLPQQPAKLHAFRKKFYPTEEDDLRKSGHWKEAGAPVSFVLQPLQKMHTDTKIWGDLKIMFDHKIDIIQALLILYFSKF